MFLLRHPAFSKETDSVMPRQFGVYSFFFVIEREKTGATLPSRAHVI